VDRYIQRLIEQELDERIEAHGASGGTILVMDPMTGAILGMASRPSFQLSQLNLEAPDPASCSARVEQLRALIESGPESCLSC